MWLMILPKWSHCCCRNGSGSDKFSDLEGYKRELEYHFKVNYKIKKDIFNNEDICEKCAGDE